MAVRVMMNMLMVLALKIIFLNRHLILLQLNDWPCSRGSNQMQRIAIVWNRDWNLSSDLDLDFVIGYLSRQSSRKLIIITTWKDTSVYMAGFYTTVSYFWKLDLDSDFVKYVKALGPWTCEKQNRVRWLSKHQSTWTEGVRLVSLPPPNWTVKFFWP